MPNYHANVFPTTSTALMLGEDLSTVQHWSLISTSLFLSEYNFFPIENVCSNCSISLIYGHFNRIDRIDH